MAVRTDPIDVVCADDHEEMRALYHAILEPRGHRVRTCGDGESVFSELTECDADLLLLDIDMPGMSGLDVCRELRRRPDTCAVPIIMVSSHESEDIIVEAITSGADDYIIKPLKASELLAKSATVRRKRKALVSKELGLPVGSFFAGRYRINDKLGSGGFSTVYSATDISSDKEEEVALKIFELTPQQSSDQDQLALFLREAYGLSKLSHPNIIRLHDFGQSDRSYFLAMEFLSGKTLREILGRHGAMPECDVAAIGYEIVLALTYLDSCHVVHRDLTPNNVMIVDSGQVKLIDFGMAKQVRDTTLSPEGMFSGTPQYAAPEIIDGIAEIDTRADIFSLGATLYVLLTDQPPFSGETPMEVFRNRYREVPSPPSEINDSISAAMSDLIDDMLCQDAEGRPSLQTIRTTLRIVRSS